MTTFKPQDSKREEFRKYLERAGVMDAITKIFTSLYEELEKPTDALGYIYKALGEDRPNQMDYANDEALESASKIQKLETELAEAKAKIQQLEEAQAKKVEDALPPPPSPAAEPATPAAEPLPELGAPKSPADVPMAEEAVVPTPEASATPPPVPQ